MAEKTSLKALADAVLTRDTARDTARDGASQGRENLRRGRETGRLTVSEPGVETRENETVGYSRREAAAIRLAYSRLDRDERQRLRAEAAADDPLAELARHVLAVLPAEGVA